MTKIYRVFWKKNEIQSDRCTYSEFLDLSDAEAYKNKNDPNYEIEILSRELTQLQDIEPSS